MDIDLNVSVVQYNIAWNNAEQNIVRLTELVELVKPVTHLVILPEMFATGFITTPQILKPDTEQLVLDWMQTAAKSLNTVVAGSHPVFYKESYRNRFIFMFPNGNYEYYDKHHLFTYSGEHKHYKGGDSIVDIEINGWKIRPLICYDLRFPVWSRNTTDYDLLIYSANWPAARKLAWNQLLPARAIENQCYVVGANCIGADGNEIEYAGQSQIISPEGKTIGALTDEESVLQFSLNRKKLRDYRNNFPVLGDRDEFWIQ